MLHTGFAPLYTVSLWNCYDKRFRNADSVVSFLCAETPIYKPFELFYMWTKHLVKRDFRHSTSTGLTRHIHMRFLGGKHNSYCYFSSSNNRFCLFWVSEHRVSFIVLYSWTMSSVNWGLSNSFVWFAHFILANCGLPRPLRPFRVLLYISNLFQAEPNILYYAFMNLCNFLETWLLFSIKIGSPFCGSISLLCWRKIFAHNPIITRNLSRFYDIEHFVNITRF